MNLRGEGHKEVGGGRHSGEPHVARGIPKVRISGRYAENVGVVALTSKLTSLSSRTSTCLHIIPVENTSLEWVSNGGGKAQKLDASRPSRNMNT